MRTNAFITFAVATFSVYILAQSYKQSKRGSMAGSGVILQRDLENYNSQSALLPVIVKGILRSDKFLELGRKSIPKGFEDAFESNEQVTDFVEKIQCGEVPANIAKLPSNMKTFFMVDFLDILNKATDLPPDQLDKAKFDPEYAVDKVNDIEDGSIPRDIQKTKPTNVTFGAECPFLGDCPISTSYTTYPACKKTDSHTAKQTKPPTITTPISSALSSAHSIPNSTAFPILTAPSSPSIGSTSTIAVTVTSTSIPHRNSASVSMRATRGTYRSKEVWACGFMLISALGLSISF